MTSPAIAVSFVDHPDSAEVVNLEDAQPAGAGDVVGASASWRKLLVQAEMAAPHLQVATIEGEHGSGKHTLARYIFSRSPLAGSIFLRRDAREWLATDADPARIEGYLYLDRIDLLTQPGQNVLLGVLRQLQERQPGRAVLLASSQTPLRQMVAQGLFQPDLAYRLTGIRFVVPPLRQRREDIGLLAQAILDRLCARYQQTSVVLAPGALGRLVQHDWPGNVRELAAVIEAALLEATDGVIRPADLVLSGNPDPRPQPQPAPRIGDLSLDSVVRQHVQYVLDLTRGNKLRAARQLGISRSTLYRLLANESVLER
ncbi:MAG TPA: helix-turn-helix domain-containing protein [Terracidiphilus sp.]|nr:helix-turn-helix domain-containing protein [Terracidiphilus sp.]